MSGAVQGAIDIVEFRRLFTALVPSHLRHPDFTPFPWQEDLYGRLVLGNLPKSCDIPTGLGKTSVIRIWLLALAHHAMNGHASSFPRRLVYIVNRRTVVDQATQEAQDLRHALCTAPELGRTADALRSLATALPDNPLAISTLRGQFADNAEWRDDPARPAIVIGTVDMIGSRLLFSGYGRGFKSRPLHAAFLGQDALLVHDEAHLEPAFQALLDSMELEQTRCREVRPVRVIALTATARHANDDALRLTDGDLQHKELRKRIEAKKQIFFWPVQDERKTPDEIVDRALKHRDSGQAILVFLSKLDYLEKVADRLSQAKVAVQKLTGTLRGFERDILTRSDRIFARFLRNPDVEARAGTVYLLCTSAGEVGINITADHLICDLTPFDSMAQRLGRVNRFGEQDAKVDVVYREPPLAHSQITRATSPSSYEQACERTLALLKCLPESVGAARDASPGALMQLPLADRLAAFTPPPPIPRVTDILFDFWSLTSIRGAMPGRPPVADWLHGELDEEPETYVAWREEVELVQGDLLQACDPADLLDDYPLKPHELLRDRTYRVFENLERMNIRDPDARVWVIEPDDEVRPMSMSQLIQTFTPKNRRASLAGCTILLSPKIGGLEKGTLSGATAFEESGRYDVADELFDDNSELLRCRVWDAGVPPAGMRLVRTIDRPISEDAGLIDAAEPPMRTQWQWYVRPRAADDDGSTMASEEQELKSHLETTEAFATALLRTLGIGDLESRAVRLAARWHDAGKRRKAWQRAIGNEAYPERVLAKSGSRIRAAAIQSTIDRYRHELGSIIDVSSQNDFAQLAAETQDLVLHLIAAHHGRARPNFPSVEAFDREHADGVVCSFVTEVPRRFARLQHRYGRWGLAYLESLLRAADALASQNHAKGFPQ